MKNTIFSTNDEYIHKMYINNEERILQRNMRVSSINNLFIIDKEYDDTIKLRQKIYDDSIKHNINDICVINNDKKYTIACYELLQLIGLILIKNNKNNKRFKLKGSINKKYNNIFGLPGSILIDNINNKEINLFDDYINNEQILKTAGLLATDDLILCEKINNDYIMTSGFLATPTNWGFSEFLNKNIYDIHMLYRNKKDEKEITETKNLIKIINKSLDNLKSIDDIINNDLKRVVIRNNWFIKLNTELRLGIRQDEVIKLDNDKKIIEDKIINLYKDNKLKKLGKYYLLRSEYESLIKLPCSIIIFTIKPFVYRLEQLTKYKDIVDKLINGIKHRYVIDSIEKNELSDILKEYLYSCK